jgi:hypothetical protein
MRTLAFVVRENPSSPRMRSALLPKGRTWFPPGERGSPGEKRESVFVLPNLNVRYGNANATCSLFSPWGEGGPKGRMRGLTGKDRRMISRETANHASPGHFLKART